MKDFPELQKVVDLAPTLSPFFVLTQCKVTEETAGQCPAYHWAV